MSAVAAAPHTLRIAVRLLQAITHALQLTDELEDTAYREAEIPFVFAAREVRKHLEESYTILEKFVKLNRS